MADFKVKCIKQFNSSFIKDSVYDVINGTLYGENVAAAGDFESVKEINKLFEAQFELISEPQQFTKDMLKTGMRVENRDGIRMIVMLGTENGDRFVNTDGNWYPIEEYNPDLTLNKYPKMDIMKIYSYHFDYSLLFIDKVGKLLWHRPEPKHYTKSEAIARLSEIDGQPVEIGE